MSELPPIDPGPVPPPPSPPADVLPWEDPNAGIGAFVPTLGRFVASPFRAFGSVSAKADLVRPIAYLVIMVLIGAIFAQLWNQLLWEWLVGFMRSVMPPQFQSFVDMMQRPTVLQVALSLIITPLIALVVLFIWSGLVHLVLAMFGGAGGGFTGTLRVVCYAHTGDLAAAVPIVGGLFAFVWRRVLEIIGLSAVHRTDGWKAALAVILPLVFCCLCVVGGLFMFGAALTQAIQQMK